MALKANFDINTVRKAGEAMVAKVDKAIIRRLAYIGTECVNYARNQERTGAWNDVTGNLRSSVGFVIYKDGQNVFSSDFEPEAGGTEGTGTGKTLAQGIAMRYKSGYVLVVVAGMNYAVNVESRGRDVLTGATRMAEDQLPEMLRQLTENVQSAISQQ